MKYKIIKYYSSFVTYEVEARYEEEACSKLEGLKVDLIEL